MTTDLLKPVALLEEMEGPPSRTIGDNRRSRHHGWSLPPHPPPSHFTFHAPAISHTLPESLLPFGSSQFPR